MKKAISIFMTAMMLFSLTACGQSAANGNSGDSASSDKSVQTPPEADTQAPTESADDNSEAIAIPKEDGKTLVVYFSWSGNTEEMASYIAEQTDGDLYEIEPLNAYPTDYNECGDVAKVERDENARPKIANLPDSIDEYDTIFIGYPIWWHTAPMIIGTFLEHYDLSGKEIYPFTQSASMDTEQFQNSMDFVRECAKGATVHDGLFVNASDIDGIFAYLSAIFTIDIQSSLPSAS